MSGADVFVDGQKKGTVKSLKPHGTTAIGARIELHLATSLHVAAHTRVCNHQLQIDSGAKTTPLARNGSTFPLQQAKVGGCG